MAHHIEISPQAIDLAMDAALTANTAFDMLREVNTAIANLEAVGRLGIAGVVITNDIHEALEARRTTQESFDELVSMAGILMMRPDSPFAQSPPATEASIDDARDWRAPERLVLSGEGLRGMTRPKYDALLQSLGKQGITASRTEGAKEADAPRTYADVLAFAETEGYGPSQATRAWSVITEKGLSLRGLYPIVREWINNPPSTPNLGNRTISFLADFINRQLSGLVEPLPVKYPPERRPSMAADVKKLEPREMLLDRAQVGDDESRLVSYVSFKRFAISRGHAPQSTNHFHALFGSLITLLEPNLQRNHPLRQPVNTNNDLVYIGNYNSSLRAIGSGFGSPVWGIAPQRFFKLVEDIEHSQALQRQLVAYTGFSKPLLSEYVAALKELLEEERAQEKAVQA